MIEHTQTVKPLNAVYITPAHECPYCHPRCPCCGRTLPTFHPWQVYPQPYQPLWSAQAPKLEPQVMNAV